MVLAVLLLKVIENCFNQNLSVSSAVSMDQESILSSDAAFRAQFDPNSEHYHGGGGDLVALGIESICQLINCEKVARESQKD